MNIKKIVSLHEAIVQLVELDRSKGIKLGAATRIKLAANLRNLGNHVKDYQEARNNLILQLGTPQAANAEVFEVKSDSENFAEFQKQSKDMNELDREVKVETFTKDNLFGPSNEVDKQNQIPVDLIAIFMEYGMFIPSDAKE